MPPPTNPAIDGANNQLMPLATKTMIAATIQPVGRGRCNLLSRQSKITGEASAMKSRM